MRVSELILELAEAMRYHGDVDVYLKAPCDSEQEHEHKIERVETFKSHIILE